MGSPGFMNLSQVDSVWELGFGPFANPWIHKSYEILDILNIYCYNLII